MSGIPPRGACHAPASPKDGTPRRAGLGWAVQTFAALAVRRHGPDEARFHRLRLADGWRAWRAGDHPPAPAHAHLNLALAWLRGEPVDRLTVVRTLTGAADA